MARAKRNKPYNPAKGHDRRSRDLPRNAEVAAVEVDDPLGLEPGDKIVTLRSIRNDPLARLHTHRQIDEAQYQDLLEHGLTEHHEIAVPAKGSYFLRLGVHDTINDRMGSLEVAADQLKPAAAGPVAQNK